MWIGQIRQSAEYLLAVHTDSLDSQFTEGGTLYFYVQTIFPWNSQKGRGSRIYRWRRGRDDVFPNHAPERDPSDYHRAALFVRVAMER